MGIAPPVCSCLAGSDCFRTGSASQRTAEELFRTAESSSSHKELAYFTIVLVLISPGSSTLVFPPCIIIDGIMRLEPGLISTSKLFSLAMKSHGRLHYSNVLVKELGLDSFQAVSANPVASRQVIARASSYDEIDAPFLIKKFPQLLVCDSCHVAQALKRIRWLLVGFPPEGNCLYKKALQISEQSPGFWSSIQPAIVNMSLIQ